MAGGTATKVVSVQMPTGEMVWARITVDPSSITDSAGGVKRFIGRLESLDETIRGVVHSVGASVARYAPAETEIEFGIEVAGDTGKAIAVLAGAHAAASVKVKLTWRKGEFPVERVAAEALSEADHDATVTMDPQPQPQPGAEG